jgi:ribosome-associated protein
MSMPKTPHVVIIAEEPIRLGQFLKLANLAQDGLDAKRVIQQGDVLVNGVLEIRRGRKLGHGDQVKLQDALYLIQLVTNGEIEKG